MDWTLLGFREYPFSVAPINAETLALFTGHNDAAHLLENVLMAPDVRLVIEGARGVGTTSFANYVKFKAQAKRYYLAPRDEVSVETNWHLEALLTAVISTIVRELEMAYLSRVKNNKIFLEAKALCQRLSEAYNSFGVTAFSLGGNFGRAGSSTQPTFVPATQLKFHLQDLGQLAIKLGFKNGLLIQLNNLDVNVTHSENDLMALFNSMRDYFQVPGLSWLLVGDNGLRSFIARRVDRLDDIISEKVTIHPLDKVCYHQLIQKRLQYYSLKKKTATFPLDDVTFDYLYEVAEGRLRYIFGLIQAMMHRLHLGKLVQQVSFNLAKDTIVALAKERLAKHDLSKTEQVVIDYLVKKQFAGAAEVAKETGKNRTLISKSLNKLLDEKIVYVNVKGAKRIYNLSLDAKIAFS